MQTTLHKINFFLPYADHILCDAKRPLRDVTLHDIEPQNLVHHMWMLFAENGLDIEGTEFYLDGVLYEANSVLMHYRYARGKLSYDEMMASMKYYK